MWYRIFQVIQFDGQIMIAFSPSQQ